MTAGPRRPTASRPHLIMRRGKDINPCSRALIVPHHAASQWILIGRTAKGVAVWIVRGACDGIKGAPAMIREQVAKRGIRWAYLLMPEAWSSAALAIFRLFKHSLSVSRARVRQHACCDC